MVRPRLILASASPARLRLLRAAGFTPEVLVSGVAEDEIDGLPATAIPTTLALRKAEAVAQRLERRTAGNPAAVERPAIVVGCDSLLAIGSEVRGKPASADEARGWWMTQRGGSGTLLTGHAVIDVASRRRAVGLATTIVHFATPTEAEIDAYLSTGEPLQVAGACTLEGYGAPFVERIEGDPSTVIGLSLPTFRHLLADIDVSITDLWKAAA